MHTKPASAWVFSLLIPVAWPFELLVADEIVISVDVQADGMRAFAIGNFTYIVHVLRRLACKPEYAVPAN